MFGEEGLLDIIKNVLNSKISMMLKISDSGDLTGYISRKMY
jgi:hypothetical protein